jgi:hypothetical protein
MFLSPLLSIQCNSFFPLPGDFTTKVAFGKLNGNLGSSALKLPIRDPLNAGMALASVGAGAAFLSDPSNAHAGIAGLAATTGLAGALGAHMTASIGGAVPVRHSHDRCGCFIRLFSLVHSVS